MPVAVEVRSRPDPRAWTLKCIPWPSSRASGVEQQGTNGLCTWSGSRGSPVETGVKSRVGPGPSRLRLKLRWPWLWPFLAEIHALSSLLPDVPTQVTKPSGSTTNIDSLVVVYVVAEGSGNAAVRNHDAFFCTITCTDSPIPRDVLAAVTLKSSLHRMTRSHPSRLSAMMSMASHCLRCAVNGKPALDQSEGIGDKR